MYLYQFICYGLTGSQKSASVNDILLINLAIRLFSFFFQSN